MTGFARRWLTTGAMVLTLASLSNVFAFSAWWHVEASRKAMEDNGFSSDARLVVQFTDYLTDVLAVLPMYGEKLGLVKFDVENEVAVDYSGLRKG